MCCSGSASDRTEFPRYRNPSWYDSGREIVKIPTVQRFPETYLGGNKSVWKRLGKNKEGFIFYINYSIGMDIERVNIVFNYDMPEDTDTYLHRVARAGRFGTKGLAITFVSDEGDAKILNEVQDRFEVDITELPDEIDLSSYIEGR